MEVNEYRFRGTKREKVPKTVQKLIVNPGIQFVPCGLCEDCEDLREVSLPEGLRKIGSSAFEWCKSLSAIKICSTLESIGKSSFRGCQNLKKVEFEKSPSDLPHRLKTIGPHAFDYCLLRLERIKIPSSVNSIGRSAFLTCYALVEANLSATAISEVSSYVFCNCRSLQTVSLPNSVERIWDRAFHNCACLITVALPLDSKSIEIKGQQSFSGCTSLANFVLPAGSKAEANSFAECTLLQDRFGEEVDRIVAGLVTRFDGFPVHRLCYDHSARSAEKLRQCIGEGRRRDEEQALVDDFGMTPFHIVFSSIEPTQDLLQVLLDNYPCRSSVRDCKDATGKLAMEYLLGNNNNWTETTTTRVSLLQTTLQRWMVDPIVHWGAPPSWIDDIQSKVQAILVMVGDDSRRERRMALLLEACSVFSQYERIEAMSILEMALWKRQLKDGWSSCSSSRDGGNPADALLYREECRCVCRSNVVIPIVVLFFGIS